MLCEHFPQRGGGLCLAGGLAAHRICQQWILKHGILAIGTPDRKGRENYLSDIHAHKGPGEPWARDHQLPSWGRVIRETFTVGGYLSWVLRDTSGFARVRKGDGILTQETNSPVKAL